MAPAVPPVTTVDAVLPASPYSVAELIERQAAAIPDNEAVVFGDTRLTYKQLRSRSRAIAHQLAALGIAPGDRVALLYPNQPDYVAAFFAVLGVGATVVPVNPLLKSEEIAHILFDSQARALIVHERCLPEALDALPGAPALKHVLTSSPVASAGSYPEDKVAVLELTPFKEAPAPIRWPCPVEADSALAVLVYTSGTTGKPKGAMLSHANIMFTLERALELIEPDPSDRFLAVLPLCHIYGLSVVMLGILSRGGALVVLEKFEPRAVLDVIEKERITLLPAVPAMYQFLLMEMENQSADVSSVRVCLSGAASLSAELKNRIESVFGPCLIEGYGLTEVSAVATVNPLHGQRKTGSVGPPIRGVEVAIVADDGGFLPPGLEHVGEIAIRGANVMRGYYRQPEATAETFRGDWFLTGDLGYKDDDGYLFIVGRKKELIIRGGQNIYPREVEEVIVRMPQVAEVAVIGVPDKYMGERVKAVVVRRAGSTLSDEDVKAFCARHLAEYKVPRLVEFTDALPRNSTGKILKRLLS